MRAVWMTTAAAAGLIMIAGVASVTAATNATDAGKAPDKVSDFQLTDTGRLAHQLYYFKYAPAIVYSY